MRFGQQVAAQAHLHARLGQNLDGLFALPAHAVNLGDGRSGQAIALALVGQAFIRDERGHHEGAQLGHQFGRGRIHQVAVLNGAHAAAHRTGNGAGRVGVGHDVGVGVGGLFHNGAQLGFGVAQVANRVVGRRHAARCHHLDLRGPLQDFFAHRQAAGVHPIYHTANVAQLVGARAHVQVVVALTEVCMPAGLRQRLARREDARPLHQPCAHRFGQRPIGPARIAHGGKAPLQHALHDGQRTHHGEHIGHLGHGAQVERRGHHVHVAINQAGHQCHAACVQHRGAFWGNQVGTHGGNAAVLHQNGQAGAQCQGMHIQNAAVFNQQSGHELGQRGEQGLQKYS